MFIPLKVFWQKFIEGFYHINIIVIFFEQKNNRRRRFLAIFQIEGRESCFFAGISLAFCELLNGYILMLKKGALGCGFYILPICI